MIFSSDSECHTAHNTKCPLSLLKLNTMENRSRPLSEYCTVRRYCKHKHSCVPTWERSRRWRRLLQLQSHLHQPGQEKQHKKRTNCSPERLMTGGDGGECCYTTTLIVGGQKKQIHLKIICLPFACEVSDLWWRIYKLFNVNTAIYLQKGASQILLNVITVKNDLHT